MEVVRSDGVRGGGGGRVRGGGTYHKVHFLSGLTPVILGRIKLLRRGRGEGGGGREGGREGRGGRGSSHTSTCH